MDNDLNDPEDAYDASDPIEIRLLNFVHRITWLADHSESFYAPRLERLRDDIDQLRSEFY